MAAFVKGDVVVVPFPFSDLTNAKRRPAIVLAALARNDLILCLITSQTTSDAIRQLLKIAISRLEALIEPAMQNQALLNTDMNLGCEVPR